jgi:hypothetical protein
MVFCKNPPVEGTVNSMEQKTRVFCQIDVQEFHLGAYRIKPKAVFLAIILTKI